MTRFCFLLTIRNLNYFWNAKIFYYSYIFKGAKLAKFIRFEAGWKLYIFYHKVLWNDCVLEGSEEHWKLWRCEVEIFFFMKRFFTMLRFVQNDTVLFFYSRLGIWIILNAKIFYYSYIIKEAKLAKFIRFEALWKLYIFYHKVLGDVVKWWRFWGLWGTLEIVKMWSWNILLFEKILHYAALRSEWHGSVFYLRLGIWIIFETQRF